MLLYHLLKKTKLERIFIYANYFFRRFYQFFHLKNKSFSHLSFSNHVLKLLSSLNPNITQCDLIPIYSVKICIWGCFFPHLMSGFLWDRHQFHSRSHNHVLGSTKLIKFKTMFLIWISIKLNLLYKWLWTLLPWTKCSLFLTQGNSKRQKKRWFFLAQ